jgi:CRISPR-associated protein Csb2
MLTIEVNFLTGRFVATAHHDRRRAEWPPHPARLFSALVATWADSDHPDETERQALEWLENRPPPSIEASEADLRGVVSHFVPVNDASVISRASYMNRYDKITDLKQRMGNVDLSESGASKQLGKFQSDVRRQLNVTGLIRNPGNTNPKSAMELFPEHRIKQERSYPSVTPVEPRVTYIWNERPPAALASALDRLLSRVTRLGHSSSLVSCRLGGDPPPSPNYVPGEGSQVLRTVQNGQLATLERQHRRHRGSRPRSLPFVSTRYRSEQNSSTEVRALKPDTAGEMLIFEFAPDCRRVPSIRVAEVAGVLRATVFHHAQDPLPEGLSGHRPDGLPSTKPHVGFYALPWVGSPHADGRLMGMAIGIPHGVDVESRRALLKGVGKWEAGAEQAVRPLSLNLGRSGRLILERVTGASELVTLRPWVWIKAARHWVSATPVALPTHPGPLGKGTAAARSKAWLRAERSVRDACRHVGLPEPREIALSLHPFIPGIRPAHSFPAFRQGMSRGRPIARRLLHASVTFEEPVEGPLLLGAGRYLGLGLMRPRPSKSGQDG